MKDRAISSKGPNLLSRMWCLLKSNSNEYRGKTRGLCDK